MVQVQEVHETLPETVLCTFRSRMSSLDSIEKTLLLSFLRAMSPTMLAWLLSEPSFRDVSSFPMNPTMPA